MSFRDWYHPDRDSPDGRPGREAGMTAGVQIGSLFGAPGAAIGGAIGTLAGAFGSDGARRRAQRRATDESYGFAGDTFSYAKETRQNIGQNFEQETSLLTARTGASGGRTGEAFELQMGKLIQQRDSDLEALANEISEFRQGENYEWLQRDYQRVAGLSRNTQRGKKGDELEITYHIGGTSRGSAQHQAYTPEMYKQMVPGPSFVSTQYTPGAHNELFAKYAEQVKPSLEMYEKWVFGDAADKQEYKDYMKQRIEAANKWYTSRKVIVDLEIANRKRNQERMNNRR